MPIRAIFATGQTEITVNGLHQWDYGQTLEIYADLPAVVQVHFACVGMDEAVVRTCDTTSGKGVVTIPDRCLEQTTPITAWVFEIDETTGAGTTVKKIIMPIEARTRPSALSEAPEEFINEYTDLIMQVNAAVSNFNNGDVKVKSAYDADTAGYAIEAGNAGRAGHADSATVATYASADFTKGTIEERLQALASNDDDDASHADTAGHADTADALTAKFFKSYTNMTSNSIGGLVLTNQKAYVVAAQIGVSGTYEVMILLALGTGSTVNSTASGWSGYYCKYNGTDQTLKFYNNEGNLVETVSAVYIREL